MHKGAGSKLLIFLLMLVCANQLFGQSPGGVSSDLRLWYKAGAGTSSTTDNAGLWGWDDQSTNGFDAWVQGSPIFKNNSSENINYNPTIYFDGNSFFKFNDIVLRSSGGNNYSYSIFGIGVRTDGTHNIVFGNESNSSGGALILGYTSSNNQAIHSHNNGHLLLNGIDEYNAPFTSPFLLHGNFTVGFGKSLEEYRNGTFNRIIDANTTPLGGSYSGMRIGSKSGGGYGNYNGYISEVFVYRTALSALQKQQILTYLSIKYGISIPDDADNDGTANESISGIVKEGDYVASDGSTIIWDLDQQGLSYTHNIAGIGRDDGSALYQKQSKSREPEALISMALGDFAATNDANNNTFSADKTFMIWGSDGGNNVFTSTGAPSGRQILGRKWRVQETGTVGQVKFRIAANNSTEVYKLPNVGTLNLQIDSDGDFSSGAVSYPLTLNGDHWEIDHNFSSGDFFTVAPGGAELLLTTSGTEFGPQNIVLTVLLPSVNTTGSAFTFDLDDNFLGTASSGSDYTPLPLNAQISIPNGMQTGSYTITVIDDQVPENTEFINLSISNPSGPEFFIDNGEASAPILDDDAGPGGIGNALNVWLKADAGTSTITDNVSLSSWNDQSTQGNHGLADGAPPIFKNNSSDNINFNPTIKFDGNDDRLTLDLTDIKEGNGNGNGKFAIISVGIRDDGAANYVIASEDHNYTGKLHFGYPSGNNAAISFGPTVSFNTNAYNSPQLSPFMLFGQFTGSGRILEESRDGNFNRSVDNWTSAISGNSLNFIGDLQSSSAHFNGRLSELIVYDMDISYLDKLKIYSYLAIKYGIMITDDGDADNQTNEVISGSIKEGDFIDSDGNIIWNYSSNTANYFNDIAGIGRDDASSLMQRQSKSPAIDALITIGLDTIYNLHSQHTAIFPSDQSFLLWGNNNGSNSFTTSGAPTNREVLSRKWKVQETGSVGEVKIRVPASSSSSSSKLPSVGSLDLLVDADGDFSTGSNIVSMSLVGTNWEADVDFTNGQYFTFSPKGSDLSVHVHGQENGPVNIEVRVTLPDDNATGSPFTFSLTDNGTGTAQSGVDYSAIPPGAVISIPHGSSTGSYLITVLDDQLPESNETIDLSIGNPSSSHFFVGIGNATANIFDNDAGPGGVGNNLNIWLKANAGTNSSTDNSDVLSWADQSNSGKDAIPGGNPPKYRNHSSVNINYNPVLKFDGYNDFLTLDLTDIKSGSGEYTLIGVGIREDGGNNFLLGSDGGTNNNGLHFGYSSAGTTALLSHWNNDLQLNGLSQYNHPNLSPFLLFGSFDGNGRSLEELREGNNSLTTDNNTIPLGGTETNYIGYQLSGNEAFAGRIGEIIVYNSTLSNGEKQRLYSYLALKYGMMLPADNDKNGVPNEILSASVREGDYVASDGLTVIWNYQALGATYFHDIAGIGRDDASEFHQKQAVAAGSDALVKMGVGTVAATNTANSSAIATDKSFLLWGNNDGNLTFTSTGAPSNRRIVERSWRVQETGTIGTVQIKVAAHNSSSTIKLPASATMDFLIDSDGDFSQGATIIPMSLQADQWVAEANFTDGDYFTFSSEGVSWDVSLQGAENGPTNIVFTLTLPAINTTGSAITFDVTDAHTGSASSGIDYTSISGSAKVSVPNTAQSGTFTVSVLDDILPEANESVNLIISNPSHAEFFIANNSATGTIQDNDVGPGAVGNNLVLWLKANSGTSTLTNHTVLNSWLDQSPSANNASEDGSPPLYLNNAANNINYNPGIEFDGINDRLALNLPDIRSNDYTIIAIGKRKSSGINIILGSQGTTDNQDLYFGYRDNNAATLSQNRWSGHLDLNGLSSYNTPIQSPYLILGEYNGSTRRIEHHRDNAGNMITGSHNANLSGTKPHYIGDLEIHGNYTGTINEIIVYNRTISALEKLKIYSYLSLKYGLTITNDNDLDAQVNEVISGSISEGDYVASNGAVIWSYDGKGEDYFNNVAGIGRDDESNLNQRQSRSENVGALVSMGLGEISPVNTSNPNAFATDLSFLLWGNNNGSLTFSATGAPSGKRLIQRTWKVQKTGTFNNIAISVPAHSSSATSKIPYTGNLHVVVDADGDFSSGATVYPLTRDGDTWEGSMQIGDGEYFSFIKDGAYLSTSVHGNEDGPISIQFAVNLSGINTTGNTVTFDLDDLGTGSASAGSDYVSIPSNAQISVLNGDSVGYYTVQVIVDGLPESLETIDVAISNPSTSDYHIEVATATANISDYSPELKSPGGVSYNLAFWLMANRGTGTSNDSDPVMVWSDQSPNNLDAIASGSAPLLLKSVANYNAALHFAGNGGFNVPDNPAVNNNGPYSAKSLSISFITPSDIISRQMIYEQGDATTGFNIYLYNGAIHANTWVNSVDYSLSTAITESTSYILTYIFDGSNSSAKLYLQGVIADSIAAPNNLPAHSGDVGIGTIIDGTQYYPQTDVGSGDGFGGKIMELAYYNNKAHNYTDRRLVESYLAIKYGIGVHQHLIASDEIIIWNSDTESPFNNNVTAIGVDSLSELYQKQSVSAVDDLIHVGIQSIETDNEQNAATISGNRQFLFWAHNNGSLTGLTDNSTIPAASGIVDVLNRKWKISSHNFSENIEIGINHSALESALPYLEHGGTVYLRTASDPSFSVNVIDHQLSPVNLNSERFWTIQLNYTGTIYLSIVQKDLIIWTGNEWRGGMSNITSHAPSDDPLDQQKKLVILSGDTAYLLETAVADSMEILNNARVKVAAGNCLDVNQITNQGELILDANASGYSQYKGPAITAIFRQYIDSVGWHNIASPFSDATLADLDFIGDNGMINYPLNGQVLDSCNYCNIWWYDPSTFSGENIGFGGSSAYGTWKTAADSTEAFDGSKGWNMYFDTTSNFTTAPWTLTASGTLNSGSVIQSVNENNGGWNLVANPYPSAIDWNSIDDNLPASGIASAYHIWDHTKGNYATYALGIGTLGASQYIAPFQSFYIQTTIAGAANSGDVMRNFQLTDEDRPEICSPSAPIYKTAATDAIMVKMHQPSSGRKDEAILRFSADGSRNFVHTEDISKLLTTQNSGASFYFLADQKKTVITTYPFPATKDSIRMGVMAANGKQIKLDISQSPQGWSVYIEDLKTGKWHSPDSGPYGVIHDNSFPDRFVLHFSDDSMDANVLNGDVIEAFISEGVLKVKLRSDVFRGDWRLVSITGALLKQGHYQTGNGRQLEVDVKALMSGTYIFILQTSEDIFTKKIPILR